MAEQDPITYEQLIQIEQDFDDVDLQILRQQYILSKPLYAKRKALVSKIEHFWALAFEQSPPEVDQYIQPSDSQVFAECLKNLDIERFEIDAEPSSGKSPRSFALRMEFSDNKWFEENVIEKKFYFRRAKDNWTGLVSEPVKITWKKGKDYTGGLTDATMELWNAQQNMKDGDSLVKLPEYQNAMTLIETQYEGPPSFFRLFSYVSTRRYVTAAESAEACKAYIERRENLVAGKKVDEEAVEPEELHPHQEAEACMFGDDLATVIAEDVWPNAIKYFTIAQEVDGEMSEADFEDNEDDESDEEIDLRSLVKGIGKRKGDRSSDSPPAKTRKS